MTERRPYRVISRNRGPDGEILGSALAVRLAAMKWRPTDWNPDDERTCLFCSRLLAVDVHICAHCGARIP